MSPWTYVTWALNFLNGPFDTSGQRPHTDTLRGSSCLDVHRFYFVLDNFYSDYSINSVLYNWIYDSLFRYKTIFY